MTQINGGCARRPISPCHSCRQSCACASMRNAWRTWLREYQTGWVPRFQSDWFPDLSRLGVVNEASMPWRDWMEALERGMTEISGKDGGTLIAEGRRDGANVTKEGAHAR
ncbi:hypothetical protein [Burkholderia sp. PU8-34]